MAKFRLDKIETDNRTFRMPVPLLERLSKVAQEKNLSLNSLVIKCCEFALDNLDEEEAPPVE